MFVFVEKISKTEMCFKTYQLHFTVIDRKKKTVFKSIEDGIEIFAGGEQK